MSKPKFSIALIARNEALTLPRMIFSLKEYQKRGGDIWVLDTGSTDNTIEVAKKLGCKVEAVGDKFKISIDENLANQINSKFVVDGEEPVVKAGESLFDFASARNYIAEFPDNDMIATPDCDEIYTRFDIDKLDEVISSGVEQLEYEFVFSHDAVGNPIVKFKHCKFYNRKKLKWVGIIHEILQGSAKKIYLGEDIIKLEHYQNPKTNRSGYLKGLAVDCYNNPNNDRNSHYFAREMMYQGRFKSAIKEFEKHISMNGWATEASQSMLHLGDCYKSLGDIGNMLKWYSLSFEKEARREPLMRLAEYYFSKEMHKQVIAYCEAALSITQLPFYSNHQPYYEHTPHELLYVSYWWSGDKKKSKEHHAEALRYFPTNPRYISDMQFYGYPSKIDEYTKNIRDGVNFTFIKKGDGEIFCMEGRAGGNCDGHPYSKELGDKLKEAFAFLEGKADIATWHEQHLCNALLHRTDSNLGKVRDFWMSVKDSKKRKMFVGPKRLEGVCDLLGATQIEIPLINAFEYTKTLDLQPQDNDIFIFSCGMPAKVLIYEAIKRNPNITCIDAGSAFDPIFGINSRTVQADKETLRRLYLPIPSQEKLNKMFSIPLDIHPEKMYKLKHLEPTDSVIYDLGCSVRKTSDKVIGVDIEAKAGVDIVASIDDMPMIKSDSADVVLSSHSLEHLDDTVKTLCEWKRILKDNGRIIIILPDDEVIDTMGPLLSGGLHKHAFTRDSFRKIIEGIPGLEIEKLEVVVEGWSFGGVIRKKATNIPKISFVIPTLGREEGLKRCLDSIEKLNYPKDKIEIIVKKDSFENRIGVPKLVKQGVEESTGDWVVFGSDDTEFTPDSINEALAVGVDGYAAFNTGNLYPDGGNANEHFMIRKDIIEKIGEVFDTRYFHTAVDNLLMAKMQKLGIFKRAERAIVKHYHFTKGAEFDKTYQIGWKEECVKHDRALLAEDLKKLKEL
jgi:glycosyltransferase involved in cell wall biosynthesis